MLESIKSAAVNTTGSKASPRPLPKENSNTSFAKTLLLLVALLLAGVGVSWAQLLPTTRYSLSDIGTNQFALVNLSEGKALYCSNSHNANYGTYENAFVSTNNGYAFVLVQPQNGTYDSNDYLLKFVKPNGENFSVYGVNPCYLNSTPDGNTIFVLGLTGNDNHTNGQDLDNGAVWTLISQTDGTFKLKNKGTNKYLNGNSSVDSESSAASWSLCSVGDGCKVEFNATDGSMGSVTATVNGTSINSGDYVAYGTQVVLTAHPNSGYVFKSWSNGETSQTRTWTVTQNGHPTANFEAGFTVTFGPNHDDWGTVTATVNGQAITSGTAVASGTQVQFTATAATNYLTWQWQGDNTEYNANTTVTISKTTNITHKFTRGYKISAIASNGQYGSVVATGGGKNGNDIHVTPYPYQDVIFKATPKSGCSLVGWYYDVDCTRQVTATTNVTVDGNNVTFKDAYFPGVDDDTSKSNVFTLWAKFKDDTKYVTANLYCNHYVDGEGNKHNGSNNLGAHTLNASSNVESSSYDGSNYRFTVTTGAAGGYAYYKFNNKKNFSDLKGWNIGVDMPANVSNIAFYKDGQMISDYWQNPTSRDDLTVDQDAFKEVDEIRINLNNNTTTVFSSAFFNFKHADRVKPVLSEGTATDMRVQEGENLILNNGSGFWRQCTDNTYNTVKSDGLIPTSEWKQRYEIPSSSLTVNSDYYFRVKDEMTCGLGYTHTSEVVNVHVKVVPAIKRVTVNGTERQYDVYAPDGISGTVGVVISLHGASNDWWNGRVDFDGIAETEKNVDGKKFVVVYPRGLMRQLRGTERGWESYTESNTEDVDFFKAIVNKLNTDFNGQFSVDMSRIYLAGFSNGGMMAYKAAHQAGDFFAAFASVGGYPVNESHLFHAGKQPTPFIHIQGKADDVFPADTYPLSVVVHNMIYRNGASFFPAGNGNGAIPHHANIEEDCHQATVGGAAYYMYKVEGMGHVPSYNWDGVEGDDVASTMWAFFNKDGIANSIDESLKFRIDAPDAFWDVVTTGETAGVPVGYIGFDNVNTGTSVLSYGGYSKKDNGNATYDKDVNNKNLWHSLQFKGGAHYLKLDMETTTTDTENTKFFMVTLTKTGSTTPIFSRRYQAGKGRKALYINFNALEGFNEYKLTIVRSKDDLTVKVHDVEFHSGYCEDAGKTENQTTFVGLDEVFSGMNPIYQPVYGNTYDGIAKEYLPIANIPANDKVTIADALTVNKGAVASLASTVTEVTGNKRFVHITQTAKDTEATKVTKQNNACILGTYTIDNEKGLNISNAGRAMMPEYLAGTQLLFPDHGVMAVQVQGTLDLTFLALNTNEANDDGRRTLKAYYTNDQLDGELKEMKEWWFHATRNEDNKNGYEPLVLNVRLQHLGQDGTCKIVISYEGKRNNGNSNDLIHAEADNDDVWIKGIVVKRPDLKVTIGRTDDLYYNENKYGKEDLDRQVRNNTKTTCFGNNKPYQWNFGTAGFANTKKADLDKKKVNVHDGRTYICGVGPNGEALLDHVLVYSEGEGGENKAQFDGRLSNGKHPGYEDDPTDNNEHIEFLHPTKFEEFKGNRRAFNPILSDGLKVNVTGSGWFTIACAAPNGPVKMKVLSSTNGGNAYMNILREFDVPQSSSDTDWHTYKVYLKAHKEIGYRDSEDNVTDDSQGFWDGDQELGDGLDPEETQMSLYVVFEKDPKFGDNYKDNGVAADAQLNIHYMQWINEKPADYVFQREEDPKLLNSRQSIVEGGTAEKPGLYWQAGTSLTEDYYSKTPKSETYAKSAYNSAGQNATEYGQRSGYGFVSSGDDFACEWNVAAAANTLPHTEENYAINGKQYNAFTLEYDSEKAKDARPDYSDKNLEFAIPVSGSFLRFMPMKNQFISAWIVPEKDKAAKIFVLDETGKPIPYCLDADMQPANISKFGADATAAREHGWVHKASGASHNTSDNSFSVNGSTSLRIDFAALAGKEYFIVSNTGTISLARLLATNNAYRAGVEEISEAVTLTDNAKNPTKLNSEIISEAMSGTGRYASESKGVTLIRKFAPEKWASLVLPFSLNEKKFEEMFGVGAKCLHFTRVEKTTNTIVFTHHFYNMVVAGRPVFVYPTKTVENPVFTDVTLSAETVTNTSTTDGDFTFFASYDNSTIKKGDLFMNNQNGTNYWTGADNSYPGMRSFIKNNNNWDFSAGVNTTTQQTKAVFLNFDEMLDEDISTSIDEFVNGEFGENVVVVTKSTKVYDLSGRIVGSGAELGTLPAGVYIVNGKKFVVK